MRVNPYISDLFFNHDLSECQTAPDRNGFTGYDEDKLKAEAESFIHMLHEIGVDTSALTVADLIADFYGRM